MGRDSEDDSGLLGRQQKLLLPTGGHDRATHIALGGHGTQLPPDVMGQTGPVQVILNHGPFAQSSD